MPCAGIFAGRLRTQCANGGERKGSMSRTKAHSRASRRTEPICSAHDELGPVKETARGFEIVEFKDCYGEACSLQMSSLAVFVKPGTSAVWLGLEKAKVHACTGEPLSPRMHLKRAQVAALIFHLQRWLDADTFSLPNTPHEPPAPRG